MLDRIRLRRIVRMDDLLRRIETKMPPSLSDSVRESRILHCAARLHA
jgi:hypothetical protein